MKNLSKQFIGMAIATLAGSAACAGNPRPMPPDGVVYVTSTPPPLRREVIDMRPGTSFVWVQGYWAHNRRDYVWVSGHWATPPNRFRTWHAGRWHHDRRGWYYVAGYWR